MKRLWRAKNCLSGPESGQGTIEYILVLVIVIIIALTLLYRFHGGFKKYTEAFFDGYIACLLETGELPGTGSRCSSEYAALDPKNGKMLLKDNLPEPGDGGGGGGKGKTPPKPQANNRSGGGGGGEIRRGSNAPVGFLRGRGGSNTTSLGRLSTGGDSDGGSDGGGGLGLLNRSSVGQMRDSQRPRSVQMDFTTSSDAGARSDTRPTKKSTGKTVEDGGGGLRPIKSAENSETRRKVASSDDEKGFSIGGLIRLVIMILIIVAMVVFFGGQLLQILRSRDKGGGD